MTLGEGAEDTRRVVSRQELGPTEWSLAQRLAGQDNRLVVTNATTSGQETAEVVHEALIRNWPTLIKWVNRDRAFQLWLRQLKPRVDEWRANPQDEGTLLRGGPLAVAEDWVNRRGSELNSEERVFIAASLSLRFAEKRRRGYRRFIEVILATGAIIAIIIMYNSYYYSLETRIKDVSSLVLAANQDTTRLRDRLLMLTVASRRSQLVTLKYFSKFIYGGRFG